MPNYATNIFYASTENEKDLDKVEKFLDETFCDCYLDRSEEEQKSKKELLIIHLILALLKIRQ